MKKQVIISLIIATSLLTATTIFALNSAKAKTSTTNNENLVATVENTIKLNTPTFNSKNETVYVMADTNGNEKSKFIGNTLYSGNEKLPFDFKITYFLDGQEISANNLAKKSGHIKIIFKSTSTAIYQDKYIPFIAVTGVNLNRSVFSNLKIENGKIINESSDNYTIAGYTLVGLNENLNVDFLPNIFTIEADVKDFTIGNTYTVLLNEFLADLDASKLNTIDGLLNSVYQLSDGLNQILAGVNTLSDGLNTAMNGARTLYAGSLELKSGIKTTSEGAKQLSDGLNQIVANNDTLQYGANTVINTILDTANSALDILHSFGIATEYPEITLANYKTIFTELSSKVEGYKVIVEEYLAKLTIPETQKTAIIGLFNTAIKTLIGVKNLLEMNTGIIEYTNAVKTASEGAKILSDGLTKLDAGSAQLSTGLGALAEGQTKLYNGSITLKDGLTTFKTAGIDKLVNFAEKDLSNFTRNARATVNAAANYKSFGGVDANSVKFIVKTPSI